MALPEVALDPYDQNTMKCSKYQGLEVFEVSVLEDNIKTLPITYWPGVVGRAVDLVLKALTQESLQCILPG